MRRWLVGIVVVACQIAASLAKPKSAQPLPGLQK